MVAVEEDDGEVEKDERKEEEERREEEEEEEKEHGDDVWKRGCYLLKPLLLSILSYHPRYILFHMRRRIALCTCKASSVLTDLCPFVQPNQQQQRIPQEQRQRQRQQQRQRQ